MNNITEITPKDRISSLIPTMQGWSSVAKCHKIYDIIMSNPNCISVEVGVFGGRGIISMGIAHQKVGGMAYGIDAWDAEASLEGTNSPYNDEWWKAVNYDDIYRGCMTMIFAQGLDPYINILKFRSEIAERLFEEKSISLLVIDGNHSKEVCSRDIQMWCPKMKDESYILMDDLNWTGVQESIPLLNNYGFKEIFRLTEPDGGEWGLFQKVADDND